MIQGRWIKQPEAHELTTVNTPQKTPHHIQERIGHCCKDSGALLGPTLIQPHGERNLPAEAVQLNLEQCHYQSGTQGSLTTRMISSQGQGLSDTSPTHPISRVG